MISVLGMAGGPLLGLFIMGMFLPCVNAKVNKSINLCFAYKGWGMLLYGLIHVPFLLTLNCSIRCRLLQPLNSGYNPTKSSLTAVYCL